MKSTPQHNKRSGVNSDDRRRSRPSYEVIIRGQPPGDLVEMVSKFHALAVSRRSRELVAENADHQATEDQA